MRISLLISLLIFCCSSFAQTFTGKVVGKDREPLVGASVVATAEGNKTVAFCIAGDRGEYKLTIPDAANPEKVTVTYMGYQRKTFPYAELKDGMVITMTEGEFQLKEVKIKSQRIKTTGDTLTYSVAGFKQPQDRSIADVIARMPGVEVKENGEIEYQGKPINMFYIEGLDLMGSQYGMASNNLSADKVESVQVLENHQAVKSLRGISFSESAALNLVLKDEAKAVWTGAADVGLGYGTDFLYDCRLMGMRFSKKFQTLMMYKNNDTGHQLGDEVLDLASLLRGRMNTEDGILSMMSVGSPDLAEDRYTFNHSHLVAGNWLWKTGENSELRLQGNGLVDQTEMNSHTSTTYITLADMPMVLEDQEVTNTRSEWKGEVNYQYNGDKMFIKNNVRGYIDFNKSIGTIICNDKRTDLMVKPHKRSLSEDFMLSRTTSNGDVIGIGSYWLYNYLPGQLLTVNGMTEKLNLGFFSTKNDIKYKLKLGSHYLNNEAGIDADYQNIEVAMDDAAGRSDAYMMLRAYWEPSMSFVFGKHRIETRIKLSYVHQAYRASKSNQLWVEPFVMWNWKASKVSEFSANASYYNSPIMGKSIYDTPVFTSYRTQCVNRGRTDAIHNLYSSLIYRYTNAVSGIFFNIRQSFARSAGNILYENALKDNVLLMMATDRESTMTTVGTSARLGKSFGWAKTTVGLSASYDMTDYSLLVSGNVDDARMHKIHAGLDYSLWPVKILSIKGHSDASIIRQQNLSRRQLSSGTTMDWEHHLDFHFIFGRWMLTLKNELFHTSEEGVDANYFCDFAASYRTKRWELSLNANNMIGTSIFERRVLGNTLEQYTTTILRPREFLVKWSVDL